MKREQIGDSPLYISLYSVRQTATRINERGTLEIIFCLKGSVKFTYAYEEFTLHEGEYISVDKDAYYLSEGKDNICVSFYIDLNRYTDRYPFISSSMFICEGIAESTVKRRENAHERLKGIMIATLTYILNGGELDKINIITGKLVDLFVSDFDIFYFHTGKDFYDEETSDRIHEIISYLQEHMSEKITIDVLADKLGLSKGYTSEFLRKNIIGFRKMLTYLRVNESERHLLESDRKIIDISEACGFSDVKYYYAAFKMWHHCTPNQFRNKYGKSLEDDIEYLNIESIKDLMEDMMIKHYMEIFM